MRTLLNIGDLYYPVLASSTIHVKELDEDFPIGRPERSAGGDHQVLPARAVAAARLPDFSHASHLRRRPRRTAPAHPCARGLSGTVHRANSAGPAERGLPARIGA